MSSLSSTNPSNTQTDVVRLNPQNHQSYQFTYLQVQNADNNADNLKTYIMAALDIENTVLYELINQNINLVPELDTDDIVTKAITLNNIGVLKLLHSLGGRVTTPIFTHAANNNRLDIVKEFFESTTVPIRQKDIHELVYGSIKNNNLDICRYVIDNNYYSALIENNLIENREIRINTAYSQFSRNYKRRLLLAASSVGNVSLMEYLYRHGFLMNEETCAIASFHNNYVALVWLHENGCQWDDRTIISCCIKNNIRCLEYAIQNGCPVYGINYPAREPVQVCGLNRSFECLKFLYQQWSSPQDFWNIRILNLEHSIDKIDLTDPFWNFNHLITLDLSRNPLFKSKVTAFYLNLSNELVLEFFGHKKPKDDAVNIQSTVYIPRDLVNIFTKYNNL